MQGNKKFKESCEPRKENKKKTLQKRYFLIIIHGGSLSKKCTYVCTLEAFMCIINVTLYIFQRVYSNYMYVLYKQNPFALLRACARERERENIFVFYICMYLPELTMVGTCL